MKHKNAVTFLVLRSLLGAVAWLHAGLPHAEVLWASVREVFNIFQANAAGAHIVTVPHDILHKAIALCGRDLDELSLDTVQMFDRDAKAAGYTLATTAPAVPAETAAWRQAA